MNKGSSVILAQLGVAFLAISPVAVSCSSLQSLPVPPGRYIRMTSTDTNRNVLVGVKAEAVAEIQIGGWVMYYDHDGKKRDIVEVHARVHDRADIAKTLSILQSLEHDNEVGFLSLGGLEMQMLFVGHHNEVLSLVEVNRDMGLIIISPDWYLYTPRDRKLFSYNAEALAWLRFLKAKYRAENDPH
jgi:hypothetical protein